MMYIMVKIKYNVKVLVVVVVIMIKVLILRSFYVRHACTQYLYLLISYSQ